MKQNYVTMTELKKLIDNYVKHVSLLIRFLTLFGGLVKITPDIKPCPNGSKTYDNHR